MLGLFLSGVVFLVVGVGLAWARVLGSWRMVLGFAVATSLCAGEVSWLVGQVLVGRTWVVLPLAGAVLVAPALPLGVVGAVGVPRSPVGGVRLRRVGDAYVVGAWITAVALGLIAAGDGWIGAGCAVGLGGAGLYARELALAGGGGHRSGLALLGGGVLPVLSCAAAIATSATTLPTLQQSAAAPRPTLSYYTVKPSARWGRIDVLAYTARLQALGLGVAQASSGLLEVTGPIDTRSMARMSGPGAVRLVASQASDDGRRITSYVVEKRSLNRSWLEWRGADPVVALELDSSASKRVCERDPPMTRWELFIDQESVAAAPIDDPCDRVVRFEDAAIPMEQIDAVLAGPVLSGGAEVGLGLH